MSKKLTFLSFSTVLLGLAATAFLIKTDPAIAQQSDEALQEIVIEASAVEIRTVEGVGRDQSRVLELTRSVSYSDLDLSLYKDVVELEERIYAVAKEVCEDLADEFPRLRKPEPSCIRNAVLSATNKADEVIAAANEFVAAAN